MRNTKRKCDSYQLQQGCLHLVSRQLREADCFGGVPFAEDGFNPGNFFGKSE